MAERIVNLLQAVHIHHKKQHSSAGSAPKFQLAFCQGHKAATVVQASEFVGERKIAQFCLQHVLLGGAADSAHQRVADARCPRVSPGDVPSDSVRTSRNKLASSRFASERRAWKTSSVRSFSLRGNKRGTPRRNNDWKSTVMLRIAPSDGLFADLKPACRFRELLVNLVELIGICAYPRSADGLPLRSPSPLTISLAPVAL